MTNAPPETTDRQRSKEQFEILLIEDNAAHVRLLEEAVIECGSELSIRSVADGEAALEALYERLNSDASLPDLVLVDLHLPGVDGGAVIEAIRDDPQLQHLPMVMLTSSDAAEDVMAAYADGANAYLTKPTQLDGLIALVEVLELFWFGAAELPRVSQQRPDDDSAR